MEQKGGGAIMGCLRCLFLFLWVISFIGWIACFALYIAKGKEMIAEKRKILYLMCMFSVLMIIFSFLKNGVTQCI